MFGNPYNHQLALGMQQPNMNVKPMWPEMFGQPNAYAQPVQVFLI